MSLPGDISHDDADIDLCSDARATPLRGDRRACEAAAALLAGAQRPGYGADACQHKSSAIA